MTNKTKQKTKGVANDIDAHVGQRLRVRRSLLGLSQESLAGSVGLTFQQIQKYERGANRISASRLYDFCNILGVPVSYFFEQMGQDLPSLSTGGQAAYSGLSDNAQEPIAGLGGLSENIRLEKGDDLMGRKETLDLVRVYYSVEDPEMRKDIMRFIKSMAERLQK